MREGLSPIASKFPDIYWRERDDKAEFPQEYFDTLASAGWFNLNVPQELGGTGLGLTETSIVIHELSRKCGMAAGDLIMAICVFAIQTIKTFAQNSLKERLLPELGAGKHIMSFALTEPAAGVNTLDIQTSAKKEGDGYVISGQKVWITLAHKATLMNVVARTTLKSDATKRTEGLSLFLVEMASLKKGQIRTKKIDDISMRALGSNEVFLEDVYVSKENVLGELDKGWEVLPILLNAERISTAAMGVGLGELVLKKAIDYAKNRIVFSKPIGANQAIQFPLARSKADLEGAWAVTQRAGWEFDNGLDCAISANVAAYIGARAAFFAADRAIQTFGGLGYAKSSDIER
ncbi:MAG: acyl-CoA/acyl-ACP dehydrogenase, partial [Thaumarchaeota archaeon]|nr:acyl-CoA/acyl-ACP dehydrogenase [Nitrososphaerota archaeon]